jgi:hypothetical protein
MTRLEKLLAALQHSLGVQKPLRARAVRRMKARHRGQVKAERQKDAADNAAERLRAKGHIAKAARKEAKAQRLEAKAEREKRRAITWRSRARKLTQRIHGITTDLDKVQVEIKALGPTVDVEHNQTTGGTFGERWRVSNLASVHCCSSGRRRNAYSQSGSPDIWHPYGPGPAAGRRDDCSSYVTSQALATGADDPNGANFSGEGFTGTLVGAHGRWRECSLAELHAAGQGYIVYGSGSGHHTEAYCPSSSDIERTVGHGDAAVNFGTVHLFGAGEVERYFCFS